MRHKARKLLREGGICQRLPHACEKKAKLVAIKVTMQEPTSYGVTTIHRLDPMDSSPMITQVVWTGKGKFSPR